MDSTHAFSFGLLIVSAIMAYWHHRAWLENRSSVEEQASDSEERLNFIDRQYRRRMQISAMLGIVALAMFASRWLDPWRATAPWVYLTYWGVIVLVVLWIMLLAMADYIASRHNIQRTLRDQLIEEARFRAQAQGYTQAERNKAGADKPGESDSD